MKLIKKFLPLILVLVLLLSCSEKQNLLKIDGELYEVIEIDSITPRSINRLFYSEVIESIYFYNRYNNSIYFYNLSEKSWLITAIPESYLKNENLNIGDVYFHNSDSIFAQDLTYHKILLFNQNSEVVNEFATYNPVEDDHLPGVSGNTQLVLDLPYLYLQVRPTQNAKYRKRYLLQRINLENGQRNYLIEDTNQTNYSSKGYERYTYNNQENKELFISQPFADQIIKFNYESGDIEYIDNVSELGIKKPTIFNGDYTYIEHYLLGNQWYGSILFYDADTLFLRSIYQGMDIPKNSTIKNYNYRSLNNDTILFNTVVLKNNEVLGTLRDFNLYNSSFVHRGFLYTLDFDYRQGDEDIIVFKKVELSGLSNEK